MLFNSLEFIFIFLPIVVTGYYILEGRSVRQKWLTVASYFFYGFWNYKFIPILFGMTCFDFFVGKLLCRTDDNRKRKLLIMGSVTLNLSLLVFFKYFYFLTANISSLLSLLDISWQSPGWKIILPVGISFYTFQSMSYTIDVYRNKTKAYDDFWAFAEYISLYPQLIAGPIIRHHELVPQILNEDKVKWNSSNFSHAIYFFCFGLAKKILIADRIGILVDTGLDQLSFLSMTESWLCAIGYTLQLYFDFSGYSDMAVGLGLMLGLRISKNFDSPYQSRSITDFWRRWHISLSLWLRDYLYFSLGGSRNGVLKNYRNLFFTMLLGGFWHGASWTFIVWGGYHGILLVAEKLIETYFNNTILTKWIYKIPNFLKVFSTFLLIVFGWIIFRSPDINFTFLWFRQLFNANQTISLNTLSPKTYPISFLALIAGLYIVFNFKNLFEQINSYKFSKWNSLALSLLFFLCIMYIIDRESLFLYFNF